MAAGWTAAAEALVTDRAASDLLRHPAKRLHLRPFLGRSAGLAEAAALLGMKKPAMSYWIGRLLALGLIRACEDAEPVRGRRIQRYRCIADRLRVNLADAPPETHEAPFDDVAAHWQPLTRAALARAAARQARYMDLVVEANDAGGLRTEMRLARPGASRDEFVFCWGRLWLDAAEHDALRTELDALWERYAALSDRKSKRHPMLLHLVAVPEPRR